VEKNTTYISQAVIEMTMLVSFKLEKRIIASIAKVG